MSGTSARRRRAERTLDRQAAGLLGLEDRAGPVLHPGHHLDGRQDDERDAVARAPRDQRLEHVVGQRREQERDRGEEGDEHAPGRDESEGQALTGDRQRPERGEHVRRAREEQALTTTIEQEEQRRDPHRARHRAEQPGRRHGDHDEQRERRSGRPAGAGTRPAGSSPSARSLVSGLRRCSQLEPATK